MHYVTAMTRGTIATLAAAALLTIAPLGSAQAAPGIPAAGPVGFIPCPSLVSASGVVSNLPTCPTPDRQFQTVHFASDITARRSRIWYYMCPSTTDPNVAGAGFYASTWTRWHFVARGPML